MICWALNVSTQVRAWRMGINRFKLKGKNVYSTAENEWHAQYLNLNVSN